MTFTVKISTDNAAFQDGDRYLEVARILREIADDAEQGAAGKWPVHDYNGNTVGTAGWTR